MVLFLALGILFPLSFFPFTTTMEMPFWFWETSLGQTIRFLHRFLPASAQIPKSTLPQTILYSQQDTPRAESDSSQDIEKDDKYFRRDCERSEDEGYTLLTWEGEMARKHPRNWSAGCKAMITVLLSVYSFIMYCGSSICILSYEPMMARYGHSREVTSLVLALYVIGYGFGPLLFSPLSEMPHIGRNPPYILGFIGYVVVSIVLGFVNNFPGIAIIRFLQGFLGSPCLATAGASIKDIYGPKTAPYGLVIWVACIYCGPALGPLFASHAVDLNWRWPWWQIVCMAAPSLIALICLLPETLPDTILIHQAQRLRRENKGSRIFTATEIGGGYSWKVIWDSLIKPVEISLKDPAIAFTTVYTSFIYGIYYSFFEAFPIVYYGQYHMSPTSFGLIFLSIVAGCLIGAALYVVYLYWNGKRRSAADLNPSGQEADLLPSLPGVILTPIGLFLFGWTARTSIHWIVPTIGIAIYSGATFVIYQGLLTYVPQSYPLYAASLFAGNDFMRSCTAAVFVMVVPYMYTNLGVPKGVSILGSVSVLGVVGMVILCKYGAQMRARSRFAVQSCD